ncbi:helix-turn-helix domain-containing protein [Sphingobium sp.]|uniref:TetR/AcrR family transcriptional regulator n=1 Tax=Sphingobium sp. TaxID=1912891 RepID=UPI0028BD1A6A|nr:helix-turn-helix domain-containing protein [Sphingobium sp.]
MHDFSSQGVLKAPQRRLRRTTAEIRALILEAARALFAERGFSGATTRHIATRAEVAEPLIFNNFGSKAALFAEAVIEPFNTRFSEFLANSDRLPPDRERRSAHFVHTLYPFLRDNADLLLALVKSNGEMEATALHGLDDYFSRAVARKREQYAQAALQFDVPPELVVRYAFGMLAGAVLFRDWFFPDEAPEEGVAEGALARMLFKATEPRQAEG